MVEREQAESPGQGRIRGKWGFPDSSVGKESAAMQETPVRFLGREDPLEKGKASHSSILAWRISPGGCKESDMTERL